MNQIVPLESAPALLVGTPDTRSTAVVRRSFLGDRVEAEVRAVYGVARSDWFVLPRISYVARDDLRLRLGYLAIGGPPNSLFGQFTGNNEVVLEARYTF